MKIEKNNDNFMNSRTTKLLLVFIFILNISRSFAQNWDSIKTVTKPVLYLNQEFEEPYRQPLSSLGWEDGVHLSSDGLYLYCTYMPLDLLSFSLNSTLPNDFSKQYNRSAPEYGMDFKTNPIGANEWLHSDILYAHRASVLDEFTTWELSDMSRVFYSEGAPTPMASDRDSIDWITFTSNDSPENNSDIWIIKNTIANPKGLGEALPQPITSSFNEDNPHIIRLGAQNLVLFFDSDNRPNGKGDIDLWYSVSSDNGTSWSEPVNVASINTEDKEHQPFLHLDQGNWYLYYSAYHTDGKLAIFRAKQQTVNNWNSWGEKELVLSSGNAAGIGEPTLSKKGDLSFVVVCEDPDKKSSFNRFDSDPWMMRKKNLTTSSEGVTENISRVYPNPVNDFLVIEFMKPTSGLMVLDVYGNKKNVAEFTKDQDNINLDVSSLPAGIYTIILKQEMDLEQLRFVKQ